MEHEQAGKIATIPGRGSRPSGLKDHRASLKKLEDRLFEIDQLSDQKGDSNEDDVSTDSDTEELLNRYAPAIKDVQGGLDVSSREHIAPDISQQTTMRAAANLESTLRSRRLKQEQAAGDNAKTTGREGGIYTQTQPSTMPFQPKSTTTSRSTNKTLLSHHSSEQEDLSSALLSLATALKQSTVSFADSLTASNPIVDQATSALDKSSGGMEAAQKRMGMLRRMTEGKGRWGRLILYAWVGGLWIVLILIMFVMPKLRF